METKRKIKLLVLEDYPLDADLAVEHLRGFGFEPDWKRVDTPEDFAASLKPDLDLILADFDLPLFTGSDALEMLKQSGYKIPFILLSGSVPEEIARACLRAGADDFLDKENLAGLGSCVAQLLESS